MRTPLYDRHLDLGAKIIEFGGWEMPVQYRGLIEEHHAVRKAVGLFDVSHMGLVDIRGPGAEAFLDYLSTNRIVGKPDGSCTYTVWPDGLGGCVDDVIVFRLAQEHFFVVVNASNRAKDLAHLNEIAADFDVSVEEAFDTFGILAVQGPKAEELVAQLFPEMESMKPMRVAVTTYRGDTTYLSTTGYTGSGGCEIMVPQSKLGQLWDELLDRGVPFGIQPIGLGARDTLRMEMGFALYGHELSADISPKESVSAWTIRLKERDFLGKDGIVKLKETGEHRHACGVLLEDRGIAREGYPVFKGARQIGIVTSGTRSPSLQKSIAILLVDQELQEGDVVEIQIRKDRARAKVARMPFVDPKNLTK